MTELMNRPPLWTAADPISNGLRGFRERDVVRAGLIAGGLAFSVALLLASIQQPSINVDLLKPKPGLSQGDSTTTEISNLPSLPSGALSSLASVLVDRFRDSPGLELADARQFLDFVQWSVPNLLMTDLHGPSQEAQGPAADAAMTPELAFTPDQTASPPASGGGGGGGAFADVPIDELPAWWDIWAWVEVLSASATVPAPNVELPPPIPSPVVAAPVAPTPAIASPVVAAPAALSPVPAAPAALSPVPAAPVAAAPVSPPAFSPLPPSPPQPTLPPADVQVAVAQPASQGGPPAVSNATFGGSGNPRSTASPGGGSTAASAIGSGSDPSQPTKPSHIPKRPGADLNPPRQGVGVSGSAGSDGAGSGSGTSQGD